MINRQSKRKYAYRIFSRVPLSLLEKLTRTNLIIPYYHIVSDEEVLHVQHIYEYKTIREFREDLDFLLSNYAPTDLHEILSRIKTGRPLPDKAFLLTFDDGFREMSDIVAPILLKKGVSATFFLNSAFVDNQELCYLNKASLIVELFQKSQSSSLEEKLSIMLRSHEIGFKDIKSGILSIRYQQRDLLDKMAGAMNLDLTDYLSANKPYLTSDQINRLIKDGFAIGAHSVDHPLYSSLCMEDQVNQTIESVKFVRNRFRLNYGVFAFPHSDNNVSLEYFLKISESGLIDLSFGTCGLIDDSVPNHLQRFSLEQPIDAADRIIAFQYARKLKTYVTGSPIIIRK